MKRAGLALFVAFGLAVGLGATTCHSGSGGVGGCPEDGIGANASGCDYGPPPDQVEHCREAFNDELLDTQVEITDPAGAAAYQALVACACGSEPMRCSDKCLDNYCGDIGPRQPDCADCVATLCAVELMLCKAF